MKGERLFVERRAELLEQLTAEKNITVKFKLAFLKCFSQFGRDLEEVCRDFGIAVSTGYLWLRTWNQAGYAGLAEEGQRTGRPSRLEEWDIILLKHLLRQQPTWTTAEVRELIERAFGIRYSPDQVIRILRQRVGLHFSKPFPRDYRRPADAAARLKASLQEVFIALQDKGIPQEAIALGFLDEASPQNRANTVRVWRFEKSPVMVKNTTHFKTNTIGFQALQGVSVHDFLTDSKAASVVNFLKPVKAAKVTAKAIVIMLDNDSSHHAAKVQETAQERGIYLVYLPPYAPDLNP